MTVDATAVIAAAGAGAEVGAAGDRAADRVEPRVVADRKQEEAKGAVRAAEHRAPTPNREPVAAAVPGHKTAPAPRLEHQRSPMSGGRVVMEARLRSHKTVRELKKVDGQFRRPPRDRGSTPVLE